VSDVTENELEQLNEQLLSQEGSYQPQRYYGTRDIDEGSLRYRIEGDEIVTKLCERARGGFVQVNGEMRPNEQYRLMSEEGIARLDFYLRIAVNKINHLTRYNHTMDIMKQLRPIAKKYLKELTKNSKTWGATLRSQVRKNGYTHDSIAETYGHDYLHHKIIGESERYYLIETKLKVRNKEFLQQTIEQTAYQSMKRSEGGREQELTAPNVQISEQQGSRDQPSQGLFNWGGRNR
jgi:hypothetical protein